MTPSDDQQFAPRGRPGGEGSDGGRTAQPGVEVAGRTAGRPGRDSRVDEVRADLGRRGAVAGPAAGPRPARWRRSSCPRPSGCRPTTRRGPRVAVVTRSGCQAGGPRGESVTVVRRWRARLASRSARSAGGRPGPAAVRRLALGRLIQPGRRRRSAAGGPRLGVRSQRRRDAGTWPTWCRPRSPASAVDVGYLEMTDPPAGDAGRPAGRRGCRRVVVLPLMLLGRRARQERRARGGGGGSRVGTRRWRSRSVGRSGCPGRRWSTWARRGGAGGAGLPLLLVARGTSDPDANGEAYKAARLVAEWTGARSSHVGFSGVTGPSVPEAADGVRPARLSPGGGGLVVPLPRQAHRTEAGTSWPASRRRPEWSWSTPGTSVRTRRWYRWSRPATTRPVAGPGRRELRHLRLPGARGRAGRTGSARPSASVIPISPSSTGTRQLAAPTRRSNRPMRVGRDGGRHRAPRPGRAGAMSARVKDSRWRRMCSPTSAHTASSTHWPSWSQAPFWWGSPKSPATIGPVDRADDLAEGDVLRRPGQHVPAAHAPLGPHQAGALEGQQDLLEVRLRERRSARRCRGPTSAASARRAAPATAAPGWRSHPGWTPSRPHPTPRVSAMTAPAPVLPVLRGRQPGGLVPGLLRPPGPAAGAGCPSRCAPPARWCCSWSTVWAGCSCRTAGTWRRSLAGMVGGPITSVVPSTTATALTSLTVGAAARRHGIVGYRLVVDGPTGPEVLNVLRWRTVVGRRPPVRRPAALPAPPAVPGPAACRWSARASSPVPASPRPISATPRWRGWSLPSSLPVEVRAAARGGGAVRLRLLRRGRQDRPRPAASATYYDAELVAVDRLVGDLLDGLPRGAVLVVTADHGQVEVGLGRRSLDRRLMEQAVMLSGEGRFRWLHARPAGRRRRPGRLAPGALRRGGLGATADQMDRRGMVRRAAAPTSSGPARRRGGHARTSPSPISTRPTPARSGWSCRHGSLTADEMLVPLVAGAGRLGM